MAGLFRVKPERLFANIWIFSAFFFWTGLCLPFGLLFGALAALSGTSRMREAVRRLNTLYGRVQIRLLWPWLRVDVRGRHMAVENSKSIIVANHQSLMDIFLLGMQGQDNLCLVSKSWPYRLLFFFSPLMRAAGYIDAERLGHEDVEELCLQRLGEGATLVVFPEGRRTRTGRLGRFHAGAFRVACRAGVPVIPFVFINTFAMIPPGAKSFTPGTARLRVLEPVFPHAFAGELLPHRSMMRHVQTLFAEQFTW